MKYISFFILRRVCFKAVFRLKLGCCVRGSDDSSPFDCWVGLDRAYSRIIYNFNEGPCGKLRYGCHTALFLISPYFFTDDPYLCVLYIINTELSFLRSSFINIFRHAFLSLTTKLIIIMLSYLQSHYYNISITKHNTTILRNISGL